MANNTDNEKLISYWTRPVSELVNRKENLVSDEQKERHRLYSLLSMAITHFFWNGFKEGKDGEYPQNVIVTNNSSTYLKGDYNGHNILAIAVDFDGRVIDFEMNHNKLFNSSVEHAEARLIKRIYTLSSLADSWSLNLDFSDKKDNNTFNDISIYTTLESCSQCSGIMALAQVKEIIYLHTDNGMYLIGNILRNLTEGTKLQAPNPIDGNEINFKYFDLLNKAYKEFINEGKPFYVPYKKPDQPLISKSITSFLCTKQAYEIFGLARDEFENLINNPKILQYQNYRPERTGKNKKGEDVLIKAELSNLDVLKETSAFFEYIKINGRRATPHK